MDMTIRQNTNAGDWLELTNTPQKQNWHRGVVYTALRAYSQIHTRYNITQFWVGQNKTTAE